MTTVMDGHIVLDDRGVARVAGSRIRVIDIVLERQAHGFTPEQSQAEHPRIALAQVYAAWAYYYAHQAELDAEIKRRYEEAEDMRLAAGESTVAKRLRAEGLCP